MIECITVIVPVYNEGNNIVTFYDNINSILSKIELLKNFCILFVDDGSTDDTLKEISKIIKIDNKVKYTSLSRHFGKESAIFAGLNTAINKLKASHCVLMDVDLQDPPLLIPRMIDIMNKTNCDCVCARKIDRKGDPKIRSIFSNMFYKLINRVSKIHIESGTRDFRLMNKKYIEAILACQEYNRFFKGIACWIGFNVECVEYSNVTRKDGKSRLSFMWLLKYSMEAIVAYSTWPLAVISIIGLILSLASLIFLVYIFIKAICFGDPVAGWPSLACLILFLGSLILMSLGIVGLYFEKTYLEAKKRPIYIVDKESL